MNMEGPTLAWERYHEQTIERNDLDELIVLLKDRAPWSHAMVRHRLLEKYGGISCDTSFLDAGSGTGKVALWESAVTGCPATLFDYSREALDYSRPVMDAFQETGGRVRASFCRGDLKDLPFSGAFDIVCNEGVIEHWEAAEDRLRTVQQMVKAAKPGGKVFVFVPNESNPYYRRWIKTLEGVPEEWAFTDTELKEVMEKAGLVNVDVMGIRTYKTFIQYKPIFTGKLKFLAGAMWLLEELAPLWLRRRFASKLGHWLAGVGERPVEGTPDAKTL